MNLRSLPVEKKPETTNQAGEKIDVISLVNIPATSTPNSIRTINPHPPMDLTIDIDLSPPSIHLQVVLPQTESPIPDLRCHETQIPDLDISPIPPAPPILRRQEAIEYISPSSDMKLANLGDISSFAQPPIQRLCQQDCLDALVSRKRIVSRVNMLAEDCISTDFSDWVNCVWKLIALMKWDDQVGYLAIRMFSVVLSSICEPQPWPLLQWERYACIWVAVKLEYCNIDASCSAVEFLTALFGPGTIVSEKRALLQAEQRVIAINDFILSFPLASDFVSVLLDIVGCSESTRVSASILLKRCSCQSRFVSVDPLLLAVACIHAFVPFKWETIFTGTHYGRDDLSNLLQQIHQ